MSAQIELIILAQAMNGERSGWHTFQKRLFWVDGGGAALHAFDPATGRDEAWDMPAWIGGFAATPTGAVVALRTGLFDFDAETGALDFLAPTPFDPRRFLFNEGRCDRQGRFFAGSKYLPLAPGDQSLEPKTSPLWRYDARGFWSAATPPVSASNGLAWSPDGKTMYHSDSEPGTIWVYDYDIATGKAEGRRVFAQVEVADKQGGPRGACIDSEGFYWCALFANSCLLRFDPTGKLERRVPMPVKFPTMAAFGGDDLKTLFITSANWPLSPQERQKQPDEGGLFAMEAPAPGLPPATFKTTGLR